MMKIIGWMLVLVGGVLCAESRAGLILIGIGIGILAKAYVNSVDDAYDGGEIYDFPFDKQNYGPPRNPLANSPSALELNANLEQVAEVLTWLRDNTAISDDQVDDALNQLAKMPVNDYIEISLGKFSGYWLGFSAWQESVEVYSMTWIGVEAFEGEGGLEELFDDIHMRDD